MNHRPTDKACQTVTGSSALDSLLTYRLNPELVATSPADPRDSARLLVMNRKTQVLRDHGIRELPSFFPIRIYWFLIIPKSFQLVWSARKIVRKYFYSRNPAQVGGRPLVPQPNASSRAPTLFRIPSAGPHLHRPCSGSKKRFRVAKS